MLLWSGERPKRRFTCGYRMGKTEIRSAARIWGQETGPAQDMIREDLGESRAQIAQIGPGGENLVRFACIANGLSHFNRRNGLGAVMGSKNLKAIAVLGSKVVPVVNGDAIKQIFRWVSQECRLNPLTKALHSFGTSLGIATSNALGVLPTRNWQEGVFEGADKTDSCC